MYRVLKWLNIALTALKYNNRMTASYYEMVTVRNLKNLIKYTRNLRGMVNILKHLKTMCSPHFCLSKCPPKEYKINSDAQRTLYKITRNYNVTGHKSMRRYETIVFRCVILASLIVYLYMYLLLQL